MAGSISIPGVSNSYKTDELVEALMNAERIPLNREKENLETYKTQQTAWRVVNNKMSSLRESVRGLYSFDNPFNNKLADSSQEYAITASANRDAEDGSFQVEVISPATTDKFLSSNLDKNFQVPSGRYTFQVNDKSVDFKWKGGKLNEFVTALNKRNAGIIKATVIGVSSSEQALVIESLKTGEENRLEFKNAALDLATKIGMVHKTASEATSLPSNLSTLKSPDTVDATPQRGMPAISKSNVKQTSAGFTIPPRGGIEIPITEEIRNDPNQVIQFTLSSSEVEDITEKLNADYSEPDQMISGGVTFKGITVTNNPIPTALDKIPDIEKIILVPIQDGNSVFVRNSDGSETPVDLSKFRTNDQGQKEISIPMKEYPDGQSIVIRNSSTGRELAVSNPTSSDESKNRGFIPDHPVSIAQDAILKYEGITVTRPSNDIDDLIPSVTLHLKDKTEKNATITIKTDTETAKDALITFVGKYNQVITEINVLSQNKPEIVAELDYLSEDEQDEFMEKLGMFMGDSTLTTSKQNIQRIISNNYPSQDEDAVTMLSQIGISTNSATGSRGGYNPSQMRGYLEVDEKKLDESLEADIVSIKNLFGYDEDGDLIIDSGIAYLLDKQLNEYTRAGGILATKTSALDTKIKASNQNISKLESKLDQKEAELKYKYGVMEGTLNRLEGQSNSLKNFSNAGNGNR